MKNKEIFDSLALNAFDFLTQAVADFDRAPKYSVIHFCAAIEVLLKAKLMREHWSLVVAKPQEASRTKFEAGDFISASLSDTRARLKDIAGVEISEPAYKSFDALSKHRNKIIHFYHPGVGGDKKEKEEIASEQCLSWFHLHRLLQQWKDDFTDHQARIVNIETIMREHRIYLEAKFKALSEEIKNRTAAGERFGSCDSCGFDAAVLEEVRESIYTANCLVCSLSGTQVEIKCPDCSTTTLLSEAYGVCPSCNADIGPEVIKDALTDHVAAHLAIKDGDDTYEDCNCDHCDGYHTVVRREDKYLCTQCFIIFDNVQACDWCNDLNTGDMSDSYSFGCNHCDGYLKHQKDD